MTRLLLICPEPLGHGQPAGIGIRFLEMARVLRGDGHAVTVLSPDGGAVPGCRSASLSPETLASLTAESDAAIVQGHAANALFAHGRALPTVVDLYDPFIVENFHYYSARGAGVFQHDHATLIQSLLRADFLLCASSSQRLFYLGMLLALGRLNPASFEADPALHSLLQVVPFGVQPPQARLGGGDHHLLFGGIYDWYDPILAIEAVALARRRISDLTLTFTKHPNPDLTPQGKLAEAIEVVAARGYGAFIRFEPWFGYGERGAFFDRYALALLTFPDSLETELSMRTRVYDYLWGGLPIITSSAPGTDEMLRRYGAGLVMKSGNPSDFARAIEDVLTQPSRFSEMQKGAAQFVRDHQWEKVLGPLREFCKSPRTDAGKESFAARLTLPDRPPTLLDRLRRRIGGSS